MTTTSDALGSSLAFTISREKLTEGLAAISPAIAAKTTLPILSNILLRSTERGVRFSGTDLDLAIHTEVAADCENQGTITVPAKRLLAIAKELSPSPVRMRNGGQVVKLECANARYQLHSLPEEEFPRFPEVDWRGAVRIPAGDVQALAAATMFATSKEESRPILNGVLLQLEQRDSGDTLRFVATDGHRLALAERSVKTNGLPFADVIIPPRALQQICRLFPADEELQIARSDQTLGFRSAFTTVLTRMIEGPYPNYRQVIPNDQDRREIRLDRVAFQAAAKRLVPVASDSSHRITLDLETGYLNLRAKTPDVGDGHDRFPVRYEGGPLTTAVNASYLLDILSVMNTDEIRMLAKDAETALVFKPLAPKNRLLYLVMPIRLND